MFYCVTALAADYGAPATDVSKIAVMVAGANKLYVQVTVAGPANG